MPRARSPVRRVVAEGGAVDEVDERVSAVLRQRSNTNAKSGSSSSSSSSPRSSSAEPSQAELDAEHTCDAAEHYDDAGDRPHGGCMHHFSLVDFDELPRWMRDNVGIQTRYRRYFSPWLALKSVFRLHNETLNIWTHLAGTILALYWLITLHVDTPAIFAPIVNVDAVLGTGGLEDPLDHSRMSYAKAATMLEPFDRVIFSVFFIGFFCQMFFSTIFHIFCCVSPSWYIWTARLDYAGIAFMIVGSYFAPLYYGLSCYPGLRTFYMSTISILGLGCIYVSLDPHFSLPRYRKARLSLFVAFAFFGIFPVPHQFWLRGMEEVMPVMIREVGMGSLYLSGVFFYLTRLPESKFKGKFDLFHSHVIWHIFVFAAGVAQFYVSLWVWQHHRNFACHLEEHTH